MSYLRRKLVNEPLRARLRREDADAAERLAQKLEIDADARVVCLHVREPGTKDGRNSEDKGSRRFDSTRNARIESYWDAIDLLVARGYTVVRIGDPRSTPVQRRGLIDLATSHLRTDMLELYMLARSAFLLGSESGPYHITYLFGTPTLIANATDPIGGYPIRLRDRYIVKRVRSRATGRVLSLAEMLTRDYYALLRDVDHFEYLDNSSADVSQAVVEMLEGLERDNTPTAAQREFAALALAAGKALQPEFAYVRKWGPDGDFLGDGWICNDFAERYLHAPAVRFH